MKLTEHFTLEEMLRSGKGFTADYLRKAQSAKN